ncbi:electron transfer flavoprotein subunit alpha/FixB family protein [Psychrobium sp. 1_MG-2023]|uniref:electron transfer flavoprotein subunit alpha/FixB family protein n=1 Tax=Psychrobium sp. 1_MG-2023 TaxID=3062624 RepID=UPI000C32B05C|nr:FAD-binding protein [Psychrobium sp. 1_MG-2023]MDP2560180.1 FAD-binding protein [Psychrobium sp. 1_MG-2023]PKF56991.1 electron transfer flavoprotein subunit alpha [Alteromonadales bacterium alter-6D02]
MTILVIAEHDNASLKPETHKVVAAATAIGGDIEILVAGHNCQDVAVNAATLSGVSKVLVADNQSYADQLAENIGLLVADLGKSYSHILTAASTTGKNFLPRAAALLDVNQISDVIRVESSDTFVRPFYAGNAIATVKSQDTIKVLTIRTSAFDGVTQEGSAAVVAIDNAHDAGVSSFVSGEMTESERPELGSARVIVSGGRGMQNGENFAMLEELADKLGAGVGASRAAVDAGFVPNDMQVGQTGKIVAPELYIAVGISGAIQHLAGMKDSKVIVAINKDPEAPIFQVADYGLEADLFDVIPALNEQL